MLPDEEITLRHRLGFIGVGYLGSPIAQHLVKAGFPMVVYDLDRSKTEKFKSLGAAVAADSRSLISQVDVVLSCLPTDAAVEDVYVGTGDVLRCARPGMRVIELSTISPDVSRQLHKAARRFNISFLDVAISGSTPAAEARALTLFGGGDRGMFDAAEPIFAAIAKQWFYMGPGGSGVSMKLVVNTLLGVGMQAIAEAIGLGATLGLPRDVLLETLAKTAVVAPAHVGKLAAARKNDYAPQFPLRLMRKDFGLILAAAEHAEYSMPATEAAARVNAAQAASAGEDDFSAVIRRMEQEAARESILPPAA